MMIRIFGFFDEVCFVTMDFNSSSVAAVYLCTGRALSRHPTRPQGSHTAGDQVDQIPTQFVGIDADTASTLRI
jgi:hypothetical protein